MLFVCSANQQRSPTAEELYREDPRFKVRSAGTSKLANQTVTEPLLEWADVVVVMEDHHARTIREQFPVASQHSRFVVLGIPDIYSYMASSLQQEIRDRFERKIGAIIT